LTGTPSAYRCRTRSGRTTRTSGGEPVGSSRSGCAPRAAVIGRAPAPAVVFAFAALGVAPIAASGQTARESRYIAYPEMVVEYDVPIPMRDGVRLSADIYRPRD